MGVTDIKNINNAADKNWRSYCEAEDQARDAWNGKWGWILRQYKNLNNDLATLRKLRPGVEKKLARADHRTVRPFPETVARDIGWLSGRPEFQLEAIGPYPYTRRWQNSILPPSSESTSETK